MVTLERDARGRVLIPAASLVVSPAGNDRESFGLEELEQLAGSIEADGLMSAPIVRPCPGGRWEIVAGERRTRAMREVLRWTCIPCEILEVDDAAASRLMFAENMHRAELSPLEEARAYRKRLEGRPVAELARELGVPAQRVRDRLALLELGADVQQLVSRGQLALSWALELRGLDVDRQNQALDAYAVGGLTLEAWRRVAGRFRDEQQRETSALFVLDGGALVADVLAELAAEQAALELLEAPARERVVGCGEIAELAGVRPTTVHQWRTRNRLPEPAQTVGGVPVWWESTIRVWLAEREQRAS